MEKGPGALTGIFQIPAVSRTSTIYVHKIVVSTTITEGEPSSHAGERHKIQTADQQNECERNNCHFESRAPAFDEEQADCQRKYRDWQHGFFGQEADAKHKPELEIVGPGGRARGESEQHSCSEINEP